MSDTDQTKRPSQLIVRNYNPNFPPDANENRSGMVFIVDENGKLAADMVDAMIVKVDAATLPDQRTTVVTALLRNNYIVTDTSTCVYSKEYNMQTAVDICLKRIKEKVAAHLAFLTCCANVTVEKLIELDSIASEPVKGEQVTNI